MDKQREIERLRDLYKTAFDEKNYELAFDYCKQAALLGSVPPTYLLGRFCLSGKISIVPATALRTAMTCFTLAADCGFEPAEKMIAKIYSDYRTLSEKFSILEYDRDEAEKLYSLGTKIILCDIGETPDYKKAFEYFNEAAKLAHGSAMEELGYLYRDGDGVDKDEKKAAQYFARAARFKLAWEKYDLYRLSEDMREGLRSGKILKVGDEIWISDIRRSLGLSDDYPGGFNPLAQSAEFGNADSILELGFVCDEDREPLGFYHLDLKSMVKSDKERAKRLYKRAFRCYKKAVEAGDYWSVRDLMEIYRDRLVDGLNMSDEIDSLKKCAESCDISFLKKDIWNTIGEIYREGIGGVERDPQKADEYFAKAERKVCK